jgi:hypothetical protein
MTWRRAPDLRRACEGSLATLATRVRLGPSLAVDVSAMDEGRRRWLLPAPAVVELGLALARLAFVGLLAIALGGGVAAIFGSGFGRTFVAGDPPGTSYTAARCADFFEYSPGATSCEQAATWHHFSEVVWYRLFAGVLGLVLGGAYLVGRRLRRTGTQVLPPGFEVTVGTAMYGAAAIYLLGISFNAAMTHQTAGVGQWLSGGVVAAALAATYGFVLYRVLLSRAANPNSRTG